MYTKFKKLEFTDDLYRTKFFYTKSTVLDKKSDLRSKAQIRVTKKIKSIGRKNVQQIQKIRIHRRLYVPQSNGR